MVEENRAIINPRFLYSRGLGFSFSRMKVHTWSALQTKVPKTDLDIYSLFGPFDLICRHYRARNYEFNDLMREQNISEPFYSDVNEFQVDRIDKIEGVEMDWEHEINTEPKLADLIAIETLQKNWDAPNVPRNKLIDQGMILPKPAQKPSQELQLLSYVFIKILGTNTAEGMQLSRNYLTTALFKKWRSNIHGLFWGFPYAHYQCVVELATEDLEMLVRFVMDDLQKSFPKGVETATHLVIEHLGRGRINLRQLFKRLPEKIEVYEMEAMEALDLDKILADKIEGPHVEFKSSLRWDYKENRVNKNLLWIVIKGISAFMNTEGGVVLIGIDNSGSVVGIEKDLDSLKKANIDGFRLALAQGVENNLGAEFFRNITLDFTQREKRQLCIVRVRKSNKPAFIKDKTGKGKELYIRVDNSSRPLDMETAMGYIQMHWPTLP